MSTHAGELNNKNRSMHCAREIQDVMRERADANNMTGESVVGVMSAQRKLCSRWMSNC